MCTKNETKIHHKRAQKRRDWIDSKAQRAQGGWGLLSQSNPIQTLTNPWTNSTLKRRTEGGRHRGGGLENREVHEQITKAAINLTQVKGYLYPRDRSDRLASSTPCTRSHPTAEVLSSKRSLLRDAAILMKIRSAVLEGPRNPGRWPVLRKPPKPHAREDFRLHAVALDAVPASAF